MHILEKLWRAGYVFHAAGSLDAEIWVLDRTLRILLGDVSRGSIVTRVPNRFRDLCQEPCCMPLWGSVPCGCYLPVVPRWDGHGPGVVCEILRMLTATGPAR